MKLSIRKKFYFLILPFAGISLVLLFVFAFSYRKIHNTISDFKWNFAQVTHANNFFSAYTRQMIAFADFASSRDEKDLRQEEEAKKKAEESLKSWRKEIGQEDKHRQDLEALDGIEKNYAQLNEIGEKIFNLVKQGRTGEAALLFGKEMEDLEVAFSTKLDQVIRGNEAELKFDTQHLAGLIRSFGFFLPGGFESTMKDIDFKFSQALAAEKFSRFFLRQIKEISDFVLLKDERLDEPLLQEEKESRRKAREVLDTWKGSILPEERKEELSLFQLIERDYGEVNKITQMILSLAKQGKNRESHEMRGKQLESLAYGVLLRNVDQFVLKEEKEGKRALENTALSVRRLCFGVGIFSVIIFMVGLGGPWLLSRKIVSQINEPGDLVKPPPSSGNDILEKQIIYIEGIARNMREMLKLQQKEKEFASAVPPPTEQARIKALEEARQEFEKKVKERTADLEAAQLAAQKFMEDLDKRKKELEKAADDLKFTEAQLIQSAKKVNKKILIADDSEQTRELFRFSLENAGYEVIEACNGTEALDKTFSEHPDLLVLDMMMPELDGFSVVLQLRKNPQTFKLPVIICSARGRMQEFFKLNEITKIKDFIEKPFSPKTLVQKIKEVLGP